MSDLIVLGFDTEAEADAFEVKAAQMVKEQILKLNGMVKVTRDLDGKLHVDAGANPVAAGAVGGAFWGMLIGLIFLNPLLGLAVGAGAGALGGAAAGSGIKQEFVDGAAEAIQPGQAGLFLYVDGLTPDKVAEEIKGTKARVIQTSLTHDQDENLKRLFA
jgi:uncharacterized membrane protein